ncbi:MAG: NADAR family protein [Saprospiraceae bacterium]|jgi:ribA/ribD-fused uncharacterized protein|nr:NADAR family protein [Saprospiraceae bacterium]
MVESDFIVDGITYKTAEPWIIAGKAKLFDDQEILEKRIECHSPVEAKKWGRKVCNFDNEIWLKNHFEIVKTGNFINFLKMKQ